MPEELLTWRRVRRGRNRFRAVISQTVASVVGMGEAGALHHGSSRSHAAALIRRCEIGDGLMSIHVVSRRRGVGRVVAPRRRREALMARRDRGVRAGPSSGNAGVFVLGRPARRRRRGGPEGQRRGLPAVPPPGRVRCQVVVRGRVGILVVPEGLESCRPRVMVVRWRVVPRLPMVRVSDNTGFRALPVPRCQPLRRNVEGTCRPAVAGDARRGRAAGGGRRCRGHGGRTRHPAVAYGRRGALGGRRGALFVQSSVHHRPPRHPGGSPRSGGWGGSGGMHMVVQGGRGARHGVRDVEDDGVAGGSQHRRTRPGVKEGRSRFSDGDATSYGKTRGANKLDGLL